MSLHSNHLADDSANAGQEETDPSLSFAAARSVKREILSELQRSWADGAPLAPEDLLARGPGAADGDADVASLLFEDFCQRQVCGDDDASLADYQQRFPEHKDSLAELVRQQDFLASLAGSSGSQGSTKLKLPAVDDEVFGFRLKHELGHGAFARVFLAEQVELGGRPVVLKVSALVGNEPQTLARMQHTHIVPIYSLHDDEGAGLRAVCMPYFGGATLGQILRDLWANGQQPVQGSQLANSLERLPVPPSTQHPEKETHARQNGDQPVTAPLPRPDTITLLRGFTYVGAVAWICARLAEALEHAHQRGVYHRDIKPSNILLSADGQPMLLDFNLAHNLRDSQAQATLGGTVAYMAPEHLRALASPDPALGRLVDQRSDVYSLGMVLYEMLLGRSPFEHNASYAPMRELVEWMARERSQGIPTRQRLGAAIPPSLESIVRKCLAPAPDQRYQHAEELAEDLRRFLADRPLRHAPELSWTERIGKWRRRHPRLSSCFLATAVVLLLVGSAALLLGHRQRLEVAQARERKQAFQAGTIRSLSLVNAITVGQDAGPSALDSCAETLALYRILDREDWQTQPDWLRLDAEDRHRLAEDARELLLVLAWERVRAASDDADAVRQALVLLDRAEAIQDLPASPALWRDRAHLHGLLGETDKAREAQKRAESMAPASAFDHYLLARWHARNKSRDGNAKAVAELNRGLLLNPRHYWSLVLRGICHHDLGEHLLAAADFGQCIGLRPEFALGYFNRGCALDQAGKKDAAIHDYTAALERDPQFYLALVHRGMAQLERKQWGPALADFQQAQGLGRDDAVVHAGIGLALEGSGRHAEADAAFAAAFARSATASADVCSRIHLGYAFAVSARLPDRAEQSFAAVLQKHPQHPEALYGQAMLLMERAGEATARKRLDRALQLFDEAIAAKPNFVAARRFRAILSARRGHWPQAFQDMDWCLASAPEDGATHYAAACVAALASSQATDPAAAQRAAARALAFLRHAFHHGYGPDKAASDPDLAGIRNHPEFDGLLTKGPSDLHTAR